MTDALFSTIDLESNERAGFRLRDVEIFNWGTFDRRVWRLSPDGDTSLLTGDIGSGKSTLVDAITTLLLPANRITYNKAAGAENKERTLRSYVEGHYKSERIEASGTSRPIGLRDHRSFSVILGVFVNEAYGETVSLAQVFHQRDRAGQPDRFFVTSTKPLSIEADFTDFGTELTDLRKRLRASGADVYKTFPDYARMFRRLLCIRSEQAMDLFGQTVSMKSVGNLNEFVRAHMLEESDASARIKGIVDHFENLMKAHQAVTRAREQLEVLTPLVASADAYESALQRRSEADTQRSAVRLFIAELRAGLLLEQIEAESAARDELQRTELRVDAQHRHLVAAREELIAARAAAGGNRIAELERMVTDARIQEEERRSRRLSFDAHLHAAGLPPVSDAEGFEALSTHVTNVRAGLDAQRPSLEQEAAELAGQAQQIRKEGDEVREELASLASRTSNIPSEQLQLRDQLAADLGVDPEDLPFAGELLDVAEDHAQWRGAAERVLRGFALSLLVPTTRYEAVAQWVNQRTLTYRRSDGRTAGMRLVYERVAERQVPLQRTAAGESLLLMDTIEIADGPFRTYLRNELIRRADHRCVQTLEQFRSEQRAVTAQGQVRSGSRHEKDDRRRVDDPRNWVMGWMNERKVAALTEQMIGLQQRLLEVDESREQAAARSRAVADRITALSTVQVYASWNDLDWEQAQRRAQEADQQRQALLSGSSELAQMERQLEANALDMQQVDAALRSVRADIARRRDRVERAVAAHAADDATLREAGTDALAIARASYEALRERLGKHLPTQPDACADAAARLTDGLDSALRRINTELGGHTQSLLQRMAEFRRRWPEVSGDMDHDVQARAEYRVFHDRVAHDDLPRFESDFKTELNVNSVHELAQFSNWLRRQSDEIHSRVSRINEALGAIDYSPGRYIKLEVERTVNQEVQDFRADLRRVTDDALVTDGDQYSEARFTEVRRIIERLRGREGRADVDRAWTRRVTDVRNWFTFSASERDRVTDEEWEHYRDSDGKSGGQKEKLAYTILAASLAYQFGLEWGVQRSRDFRFAVIDEAFGRGSDASTRFALELFSKLGLQLLIVTPLQKVHVIAPYVHAIGFVDNPEGNCSRLQTMTIEEFHERRAEGLG